ncbi:MAG: sulfatase-like hydrolase/transferase, partial [Lacipirellulaceae bacterium]
MRRTITKVAAGLCCLITFGQYADDLQAQPTNVIVIVADDAGYADWGFMDGVSGSNPTPTPIPTPNLDALANRGVKFSRAYVAQSCQPTRAALVTGGYQNRIGNEVVGDNVQGLPASATTIWDRMKDQNYTTGAVGKWHLGSVAGPQGNRPETQGVDKFYGIWHGSRTFTLGNTGLQQSQLLREVITQPNGSFTDTVVESNFTNNANLASDDFTHEMGRYAVDFIDEHHDDANPFFLYQSFTAPHTPLKDDPVYFNDPRITGLTGLQRQYASMMLAMDDQIGQIVAKLEDPAGDGTGPGSDSDNISDNTLIMFVNDNGGAEAPGSAANGSDNGILRARKGSSFEGGIRVPMIIAGAGVDPGVHGTTYDRPVHGVDILPTAV